MARKKRSDDNNGKHLFDEQAQQYDRRVRRQRALFIPKFVREETLKHHDDQKDQAYSMTT